MGLRQQLIFSPGKTRVDVFGTGGRKAKATAKLTLYLDDQEFVDEIRGIFKIYLDPDEVRLAREVEEHQAAYERRKKARNIIFALEGTIWWQTNQPTH
jgi:hypothetical protein